jgi:hypothetical protein
MAILVNTAAASTCSKNRRSTSAYALEKWRAAYRIWTRRRSRAASRPASG